jgi:hypothetical protein
MLNSGSSINGWELVTKLSDSVIAHGLSVIEIYCLVEVKKNTGLCTFLKARHSRK